MLAQSFPLMLLMFFVFPRIGPSKDSRTHRAKTTSVPVKIR